MMKTPRTSSRLLLSLSLASGALAFAGRVSAQTDTNVPPPNVMLLVDSSGSMEYKSATSTCADPATPCFPTCYPAELDTSQHEKSRWIELLEVLTGSVQDYACWSQDRSSSGFEDEFEIGSGPVVSPYDAEGRYALPYHRALSDDCAMGAGVLPSPSAPYAFPTGAFGRYSYASNQLDLGSTCEFDQSADGLLDALNQQIRFGLMTFDAHPHPGDGLDGSGQADHADGVDGTWSYFLDTTCPTIPPTVTTDYCAGRPQDCEFDIPMEVGARNAAAPPWEGRMVAFGPSNATATELGTRNQWIQDVLLTTRPYGATPIAGLLHDAQDFFWNDGSDDPLNPGQKFGPKDDPLLGPECRRNIIVLLSDGEPNLDLRPHCEGGTGVCPYRTPADIANALANTSDVARAVRTYVIGFGASEVDLGGGTKVECEDLPDTSYCSDPSYAENRELQACCTLNEIALNGMLPTENAAAPDAIDHALFADNRDDLRRALARVFSAALAKVTTRTRPVFTTAVGTGSNGRAFQFFSGVDVRSLDLWKGVLYRQRLVCTDGAIDEADISVNEGDDFIANVNSNPSARRFFTVEAADSGGAVHSDRSIRPNLSSTSDGLGTYGGSVIANRTPAELASQVTAAMMKIGEGTCDTAEDDLSATQCRDRYMKWLVGLDNDTNEHRCEVPGSADCNVVGDIFHSTPQVRGRPDEFLRDDAYSAFATSLIARDSVLYTSSNDGFFHAFLVAPGDPDADPVDSRTNNELWAFIPPAVLPSIGSMYPNTHQRLLDGVPVIKDVVATAKGGSGYPYTLERTRSGAIGGTGTFRTILVQSFGFPGLAGPVGGGYFALDITKPRVAASDTTSGPKFLWQLTKDASGNELFGKTGATPLITTLFVNTGAETDALREVAVAVLPGGDGGSPTATHCEVDNALTSAPSEFANPREEVPCYDSDSVGARSLTIVRLDTGEVLRTFRPKDVALPATFDEDVVTEVNIPAPLVGEPAAFPATTGAIADRIFIGDREGRLWRIDVSDTDPSEWEMEVFFDGYQKAGVVAQPIVIAPVLSVDDAGLITVNFSTGDQEVLTQTDGMENYVYSLTEELGTEVVARVNWQEVYEDGSRVLGPMSLFDRKLFYSVFLPGTGEECEPGASEVWGVNYILPYDGDPAFAGVETGGAFPELLDPDDPNARLKHFEAQDGVVFGVGIRQQPSCSSVTTVEGTDDPALGYGPTTSTTASSPGTFQLVIQRGGASGTTGGAPIVTQTIDLPNPRSPIRIDSWAMILE